MTRRDLRGASVRCTPLRRQSATLLVVAAVLVCGTRPARAQVSMSVMPIRAELAVQPGETKTQLIQVENPSEQPLRLSIAVADWSIDASGTPLFVKRGSLPEFSMSAWIEVNPTQFEVPPGSIQTVRYTVTVPPGIPAGSYRTVMLVESLPDFDRASLVRVAQLSARIGVIVYNRIGDVEPEVEVVAQEMFDDPESPGAQKLRLRFRNPGVMHYRVNGESRIVDATGSVLQQLRVPDTVVLPRSERDIIVELERAVSHPYFTIVSQLDVGLPDLLEVETRIGAPPIP